MSVENKIKQIKEKAAQVAVKAAAVATLMTGTGAVSSCDNQGQNGTTGENKDKIENVTEKIENVTEIDKADGTKTSVVFRATHFSDRSGHSHTDFLMENGDKIMGWENDRFIEPGDTVTYEMKEGELTEGRVDGSIKAVRYKGDAEVKKKVDFGKIGKIGKDRTD